MRRSRPALILITAAAVAGCGGGSDAPSTSSVAPGAAPKTQIAPVSVGGTSIHLGDATTGTGAGTQVLPDTKVPQSETLRDGVGAGASCPDVDLVPTDATMGQVIDSTLCLLNGERADKGLAPLAQDAQLASAAKAHSQEMIRDQFFDHVAPSGSTPVERIRRTGYIPTAGKWVVGENLAWGTGVLATPKNIVKAWMNSEGHRANILRDAYTQIGFGVYTGNPQKDNGEGATFTTTFGGKTAAAGAGAGTSTGTGTSTGAGTGAGATTQTATPAKAKRKRGRGFRSRKARAARRAAAR